MRWERRLASLMGVLATVGCAASILVRFRAKREQLIFGERLKVFYRREQLKVFYLKARTRIWP